MFSFCSSLSSDQAVELYVLFQSESFSSHTFSDGCCAYWWFIERPSAAAFHPQLISSMSYITQGTLFKWQIYYMSLDFFLAVFCLHTYSRLQVKFVMRKQPSHSLVSLSPDSRSQEYVRVKERGRRESPWKARLLIHILNAVQNDIVTLHPVFVGCRFFGINVHPLGGLKKVVCFFLPFN